MDRDAFDSVTKLLAVHPSRRSALGSLLGAALLGRLPGKAGAGNNGRGKGKGKGTGRGQRRRCFPGTTCIPGAGQDASGCDFSHSTHLAGRDLRGADLSRSGFIGADMSGADLRGADLGKACFLEANLLGATLDGADLDGAIFCRTLMPDGRVNDRGCARATGCCAVTCAGGACSGWDGCTPVENVCVPLGRPCCPYTDCTKVIPSKFDPVGTCQTGSCKTDAECTAKFPGQDVICQTDGDKCSGSLRGSCCAPKPCGNNGDCPHSNRCCNGQCCTVNQICTVTGCFGRA